MEEKATKPEETPPLEEEKRSAPEQDSAKGCLLILLVFALCFFGPALTLLFSPHAAIFVAVGSVGFWSWAMPLRVSGGQTACLTNLVILANAMMVIFYAVKMMVAAQ